MKAGSSTSVLVDSDGEEEPSRKVAIHKRRFCDCMLDDERTDEVGSKGIKK